MHGVSHGSTCRKLPGVGWRRQEKLARGERMFSCSPKKCRQPNSALDELLHQLLHHARALRTPTAHPQQMMYWHTVRMTHCTLGIPISISTAVQGQAKGTHSLGPQRLKRRRHPSESNWLQRGGASNGYSLACDCSREWHGLMVIIQNSEKKLGEKQESEALTATVGRKLR